MLHVLRYQRKYYVFFGYTASMSILSVMNVFWKIFELHPVTRLIKQCNILFDNPLFWSQRLFEMIFMNRKGVYNFFSQSEKTWPISGNWFSPFQGSCKSQVSRYKWSLDSESRLLKRDVCILKLNSIYIYIRFNRTFGNRLESVDGTERCCQHSRCALVSHHMPSKKDQRSIWSEQVCMAVILNHTPHPPWSKRIIEADISHDQECFWIGNSRCSCYAGKICQKRISFRSLGMGTPRCETSYCAPKRKDSGVLGGRTSLVGRESTGSWQVGFSCNNRRHKPQPVLAF